LKITSVRYGRNFYIGKDYTSKEMEYFNIEASVGEGENEKQVIGELFFKVMKIHEIFEEYRNTLSKISSLEHYLTQTIENIDKYRKQIAEMEKYWERYKRGELTLKELQEACKYRDIEDYRKYLEREEQEKRVYEEQLKQLKKKKKELEEKIKAGDF